MRVKELIDKLGKQNPEYYVGRFDLGQDSGELVSLMDDELIFRKEKIPF